MGYLKLLVTLTVLGIFASAKEHYYGDKVIRITTKDKSEVEYIHELIKHLGDKIDVWQEPSVPGRNVDIHVKAGDVNDVTELLKAKGIKNEIMIEDLEQLAQEEEMSNQKNAFAWGFDYNKYNRYDDIKDELNKLASQYTQVSKFVVGTSYEGREMVGIKITAPNSASGKTAIWVDGGIHAREWISPATVMYLVKMLLTPEHSLKSKVGQVLSKYDVYILPVFNVDGYEYTHTGRRMWRKTRSRRSWCVGVDPNRNWDSKFGGAGTSSNPCSDIYRGPSAFSEKEVKQVANYLSKLSRSVGLKSYWNVHAYSQLLLFPWSYTKARARDYREIKRIAQVFQSGVRRSSGQYFQVGQPADILYAVAGGSIDWTYEKLGVKYSYAPELRPNQGSRYGFMLPAMYIHPSGMEFATGLLDAVIAMY